MNFNFSEVSQLNSWENHNSEKEVKQRKVREGIKQCFIFSQQDIQIFELRVNEIVKQAKSGNLKEYTVDRTPLRNKYFFGEGYTYGSQMSQKGLGMERVYPEGFVDPIPRWINEKLIDRLTDAKIIPENFVNSVTINDYLPGGCIVSHIDPPHIFDRPIVSLSLFSDSALCFGCKFEFRPIRCPEPLMKLDLPRGAVTSLSGYAANEVTHCIRPQDVRNRRAVIMLRRVHPFAPRILNKCNVFLKNQSSPNMFGYTRTVQPKKQAQIELTVECFRKFYQNISNLWRPTSSFGGISKKYNKKKYLNVFKRYIDQPYKL